MLRSFFASLTAEGPGWPKGSIQKGFHFTLAGGALRSVSDRAGGGGAFMSLPEGVSISSAGIPILRSHWFLMDGIDLQHQILQIWPSGHRVSGSMLEFIESLYPNHTGLFFRASVHQIRRENQNDKNTQKKKKKNQKTLFRDSLKLGHLMEES